MGSSRPDRVLAFKRTCMWDRMRKLMVLSGEEDMNLTMVGAPIFAVLSTSALALTGASGWVVVGSLFLSGPIFIALALVICKTVLPCDRFSRRSDDLG